VTDRLDAAIAELVAALRDELARVTPSGPDRLLGIGQVADSLSLGRSKVYDLIASGQLRSLKVGDRRLVSEGALREFLERAGP
jgi:excisionase family DNA binding protein